MSNRITAARAEELFASGDLISIGKQADAARQRLHPEKTVTYIIDRNINYSNLCVSACRFCAFYKKPDSPASADSNGGYTLPYKELKRKIEETKSVGGVQILMQGGLHPSWEIGDYERLLKRIKDDFQIHLHAFSPPEIVHISKLSGLSVNDTLQRLIDAGLDSIPGGGAEILVDEIRKRISPNKCTADEWISVMRAAHRLGLKTTATMMFAHVETIKDRIAHLEKIRELQDETGGFTAFIPWTFQPKNTALENEVKKSPGCNDYIKTLAVSRIFLDNVPNVQASWVTQGAKVAQMSLYFGANDFGSTMLEENVVRAAGVSFSMDEREIRRLINDAGFTARRRAQDYSLLPEPTGL